MTTSRDERLARAYRELLARRADAGAPLPATLDEIAELARTGADTPAREALLDRVLADPRTRDEYGMLRELVREAEPAIPARRTSWPLAAAATLMLVAGAGVIASTLRERGRDPMRGDAAAVELLSPRDGEALGAQATFAWRPVPGATGYTLELLSEGGDVLLSVETTDTVTVTAVPGEATGRAGVRWWVSARLGAGGTLRSDVRRLAPAD